MNCIDRIFDEFIKVRSETEISIEQMKDDILKFDAIAVSYTHLRAHET